ncbi:MAG: dihydroorotase [Betaproteobacteria bacterium]|nr:dihydroorotase [Betaproteobacteria bacterium]
MNILIQNGQVIDPASGLNTRADLAIQNNRILSIGQSVAGFVPAQTIDATGCMVVPGLVDACARLGEPGHEHEGMLDSELSAAVAGGVTSLVCPPDTQPVLDEPGLVEMLQFRANRLQRSRVFPLGALTRGLQGESLSAMAELTQAGCIGFSQAEFSMIHNQALLRAMQYACTFNYCIWLRPQDLALGSGVAASGPLASRLGLSGVPVAAETIALHTIIDLMRSTGARVHLCRLSSAAGVALLRQAKAEGLAISADVSIHNLHFTDTDMGYFDSRARLTPPLRQQRDREALSAALADGTIDLLVSDHTPVEGDAKALPFAQAQPGATGLELLLSATLKWAAQQQLELVRALQVVTCAPAKLLGVNGQGLGALSVGGPADICVFKPDASWAVTPATLCSQSKHTPFAFDMSGSEMLGQVKATVVGGQVAFQLR